MFEVFFSDPDLIYRINVINSIDFYSLGFEMVRGETTAENMLQWPRKGEVADVLVKRTVSGYVRLRACGNRPQVLSPRARDFSGRYAELRNRAAGRPLWRV